MTQQKRTRQGDKRIPVMCGACGRIGTRGWQRIGGFYCVPDVWGEWWANRFIPTIYICSARLACMRRSNGSRSYQRNSFGEMTEQDWKARRSA